MVVRYEERFQEMMAQAEVAPDAMRGLLDRLETFVHPFCASLASGQQRHRAAEYLTGLLSKLEHKTGEGIAYLHDQDRQRIQSSSARFPGTIKPLLTITRAAGRRNVGRVGRRDRLRSIGLRQEGDQVGRRGPAVVRSARQGRELSGRRLHGYASDGRIMLWSIFVFTCRRSGPRDHSRCEGRRGPGVDLSDAA